MSKKESMLKLPSVESPPSWMGIVLLLVRLSETIWIWIWSAPRRIGGKSNGGGGNG